MENIEIKLKVWDAESKAFLATDDKNVYWNCNEGVLTAHHSSKNGDWRQLEIIQFTGLLDKNGIPIYKGDIVTHKFKRIWSTDKHTSQVVWNSEYSCFYLTDGRNNYRMRDDKEYEVIGNLYQHSDLLK